MLPVLIHWGDTIIYSYPLFIGLAWGVGYRLAEAHLPPTQNRKHFIFWMVGIFLSSWIGAKLFFLMTQSQYQTYELIVASNFWLGGGFVFLGGFLGSAAFAVIYGIFYKNFHATKMQFTIVPLLWAHSIGRVGCFLAGCCYGTHSDLPWSITLHGVHRHPVQLYEAIGLGALAFVLSKKPTARLIVVYLISYGGLRWCLEWFRGDELRGLWFGQSSSQWVSICMVVVGVWLSNRGKVAETT